MTFKIDNHKTLNSLLEAFIEQTVAETKGIKAKLHQNTLEEKDKQDGAGNSDNSTTDESNPEQHDQSVMKQVPGFEDITEKLNAIRAGRSLRDESVEASFQEYFNSLKDIEKVALFTFLKGISQILTGQVSGEHASDPADSPANIKMKKGKHGDTYDPDGDGQAAAGSEGGDSGSVKHIKPNVVAAQGKAPKKKGDEDTSSPIKAKS